MEPNRSQRLVELQGEVLRLGLRLKHGEAELEAARELNRKQSEVNARLEQRVADLEMRVRRDSTSSSVPPSTDKPWDKEARRKARNKRKSETASDKNKGGAKPGHQGSRRATVEPDEVHRYVPEQCEGCASPLSGEAQCSAGRRQVVELMPLQPRVLEHRLYSKHCGCCGHRTYGVYPPEVVATGAFGPRLRALMASLRGVYGLSLRKARLLLREVFGVKVSHGALVLNEARLSHLLRGSYQLVDEWLNRSPRLFVDETSWYQAYLLNWLWVKSDGKARCFKVQARRNTEAAQRFLGDFSGLLTTDELGSYNVYEPRKRQRCLAHLHRRIRELALHPQMKAWAEQVLQVFDELFVRWGRIRDGTTAFTERRVLMDKPEQDLKRLCNQGLAHAHPRVRGLCTRTLKNWQQWWRFVVVGSEPTNNEAERSIRCAVLMRKCSYGSRSERGSRFIERMLTVVSTLRGYGEDVFGFLARSIERAHAQKPMPLIPLAH